MNWKTLQKKLKPGMRVRLKPNKKEGWNEEFGKVLKVYKNRCIAVQLEEKYFMSEDDDGLREVTPEQIDIPKEKKKLVKKTKKPAPKYAFMKSRCF